MNSTGPTHWQELARKAGDDVEIALLWSTSANRVKVVVSDARLCHHVDLEFADADRLRGFHHSFTHAAARLNESDGFGER
jgi:hypothetical protein